MFLRCALVALLAALCIACAAEMGSEEALFERFVRDHHRAYPSQEQRDARLAVFKENLHRMAEMEGAGTAGAGVRFAVNQFADMTTREFQNRILMSLGDAPRIPLPLPESSSSASLLANGEDDPLPDSWDWRDKKVVTPVKNQGSVGSCYAFSATGNIESQWMLAGNPMTLLSEEQVVDCDGNDCGVFGGYPHQVFEYVMSVGGLMSESSYPYCCGTGKCYPCSPPGYNTTQCGPGPEYCNGTLYPCRAHQGDQFAAHISGWVPVSQDEDAMARMLVQHGPLSVLLNAELLQFYHKGVYDPIWCDPTALDHAVLIVGYGVEDGLFGKKPYWLVKNSWGEKWGEDGYFKILRGKGKCGINAAVTTSWINNKPSSSS